MADSTESLLRAALENIHAMLGLVLAARHTKAFPLYIEKAYQAAEAALAIEQQEQSGIVWQDGASAPEDGTEIIVGVTYRYTLYKPDGRRQMMASGRWQCMGNFGWENCAKPERWISAAPSKALSHEKAK